MTSETFIVRDQTYRVAPWSRRIVAKVLDAALCYGILVVGMMALAGLQKWPEELMMVMSLGVFILATCLWLAGDGLFHGASVGKRLLGLRLVHVRHGSAPDWKEASLRQLKYTTFLSVWGLLCQSYDENHNRTQEDGFVSVRIAKPGKKASDPDKPERPTGRPLDVTALGNLLTDRYAHAKHPQTSRSGH